MVLALAIGGLLASSTPCEPGPANAASPPASPFAVLGGPVLEPLPACPAGSVPARVPPLSVDALPSRPGSGSSAEGCQSHGCWAWAGWNDRREMRGAGARLGLWAPATLAPDHSLAEVSLHWGPDEHDLVEVGWEVAPRRYGDSAPHLFVHRWIDGRACEGDCGFLRSSRRISPGMSLARWVGKAVAMGWLIAEGRAWAWVDGEWLGAFELGPSAPRTASVAQWFGEVFFVRPPPEVPMGNGRPADRSDAAGFGEVCDVPSGGPACVVRPARFPRVTDPERYGLRLDGPGAFRYGGPGERDLRPPPPPSSASEGTPPATGRSAPSPPR